MPERLIALARIPYGRHVYHAGETFTASYMDAKTLVTAGRAKRADDEPAAAAQEPKGQPPAEPALQTADVSAEPVKRKRGRPRKGEYLRRDMRAKE